MVIRWISKWISDILAHGFSCIFARIFSQLLPLLTGRSNSSTNIENCTNMDESMDTQMDTNASKSTKEANVANAKGNQTQSAKKTSSKTNRNEVSANWNSLSSTILSKKPKSPSKKIAPLNKNTVIALDCEMVGVGINGRDHMLARVSIVNENGEILLDKYVKPTQTIIDYRTKFSGITPIDLINAHEFRSVQADVSRIKNGRILVGHALHNDLKALKLEHPKRLIRDTSRYKKCREFSEGATPSLRMLTNCILNYDIQSGAHCSVEDARAVMAIYQKFAKQWERAMAQHA